MDGVAEVEVLSFLTTAMGGVVSFTPWPLYASEMGPKSVQYESMFYPLPPVLLALVTVLSLTQMNIQRHSIRQMFNTKTKMFLAPA